MGHISDAISPTDFILGTKVQPNKVHSMTLVKGQGQIFQKMCKNQRTGHIQEAISPTDFIISIITAFYDSFGRCPLVLLYLLRHICNYNLVKLSNTKQNFLSVDIKIKKIKRKLKIWCEVKVRLNFGSQKIWCDFFGCQVYHV